MQRAGGVPTSLVELGADNDEWSTLCKRVLERCEMKYNDLKMKLKMNMHGNNYFQGILLYERENQLN